MLLSNETPFHGSTEDELTEKIFEAKVVFDAPVWDTVSADAKTLIKKLLNVRADRPFSPCSKQKQTIKCCFLCAYSVSQPDPASRYTAAQVLKHPWIKSSYKPVPTEVYAHKLPGYSISIRILTPAHMLLPSFFRYDEFIPRVKAFCQYSALQRAALVAFAFCMPSAKIRKHSEVYNELNVAHVRTALATSARGTCNSCSDSWNAHGAFPIVVEWYLNPSRAARSPSIEAFRSRHGKSLPSVRAERASPWQSGTDADVCVFGNVRLDQQHEKGINLLEFVAATLNADDVSNDDILCTAFRIFDRQHTGGITHQNLMGKRCSELMHVWHFCAEPLTLGSCVRVVL